MSEANIQAEFYHCCKQIGLNCTLEFNTPVGRMDAAIFCEHWVKLLAIVECKHNRSGIVKHTAQIERYKSIGVPVYGVAKLDRCVNLAKTIQRDCKFGASLTLVMDTMKSAEHYDVYAGRLKTTPRPRRRLSKSIHPFDLEEEMIYRN